MKKMIVVALALAIGATAAPAFAGIKRNGAELNGIRRNGAELNGLARNGIKRNGLARNGLSRNGTCVSGTAACSEAFAPLVNKVRLPTGEVIQLR